MQTVVLLKEIASKLSVLYVEDDLQLQHSFAQFLKKIFNHVEVVSDGVEGLEKYKDKNFDIVITDILMPKMNGIEMSKAIKQINEEQEIVVISAFQDSEYLLSAIELGIDAYILKPINYENISNVLYKVAQRIQNAKELKLYQEQLETIVQERTAQNQKLSLEKIENYKKTIKSLVKMIEDRDSYTGGHSQRVAEYSQMLAKKMGYSQEECELIYNAGILHDVGKVITPDAVLLKPGQLNDLEYSLIKEHVESGYTFLKQIPMYKEISEIVHSHHERYDGTGYPNGFTNDQIHPLSRIMCVADAFDAMTTNRIYKASKTIPKAIEELEHQVYKQFDPDVVLAAKDVLQKVTIDTSISQLPKTDIEKERFSYFFRDQITTLLNEDYLDILLMQNIHNSQYKYVSIVKLHSLNNYNLKYGWEAGNKLLKEFALFLKKEHPQNQLFRIHGNCFVILSSEEFALQIDTFTHADELDISTKRLNINESNIKSSNDLYK